MFLSAMRFKKNLLNATFVLIQSFDFFARANSYLPSRRVGGKFLKKLFKKNLKLFINANFTS